MDLLIQFEPESIEALKARFPQAIEVLILSSDDQTILDPKHRFDFEDGYRLMITRDLVQGEQYISVIGGLFKYSPMPITLRIARIGLNFAAITDNRYGNGEVVHFDAAHVALAFKVEA